MRMRRRGAASARPFPPCIACDPGPSEFSSLTTSSKNSYMTTRADELRLRLEEGLSRCKVAGASAAICFENEVICASAGTTNVTTGVGFTTDTLVHIGSITKVLNATLVMQLVD